MLPNICKTDASTIGTHPAVEGSAGAAVLAAGAAAAAAGLAAGCGCSSNSFLGCSGRFNSGLTSLVGSDKARVATGLCRGGATPAVRDSHGLVHCSTTDNAMQARLDQSVRQAPLLLVHTFCSAGVAQRPARRVWSIGVSGASSTGHITQVTSRQCNKFNQ